MSANSSFARRLLRRLGRFVIALVASVTFLAGGAAALLLMSLTGYVFPWVAFLVASACSVGVFLLFDRYNLLPDDPSEPPTTLGLGRIAERARLPPWSSSRPVASAPDNR